MTVFSTIYIHRFILYDALQIYSDKIAPSYSMFTMPIATDKFLFEVTVTSNVAKLGKY